MNSTMKRVCTALLCLALALALCACGEPREDMPVVINLPGDVTILHISLPGEIAELDPLAASPDSETILVHIYENLMRWVDSGDGWAVIEPGQAESYSVETDMLGNATYTFTLREGICWSSGLPVTASDFVYAWQLLADSESPHRDLLDCVARLEPAADGEEDGESTENDETPDDDAEPTEEEPALLAVSAPDDHTFVVTLNGNPAYFLEEVCASVYTTPRDEDSPDGSFFNGPYVPVEVGAAHVALERNPRYYAPDDNGPDELHFYPAGEADQEYLQLQEGSRDLITALPEDVLQERAESGLWTPDPISESYGILLNTRQAPFDNDNIREAFHLAIDRQAIVDALGDFTARPAPGIVPYGVSDYSTRPVVEAPVVDNSLPDPITGAGPEPEEPAPTCWDYRTHALDVVTAEHTHEYETDFRYAQALLAQAGYPGGSGFPAVEYMYVNTRESDRVLAGLLQKMWRECLGVTVSVREVSQEDYEAAMLPVLPEEDPDGQSASDDEVLPAAAFQMAARWFVPPYSDALVMLEQWCSESEDNVTGYANDAFDILIDSARSARSAEAWDAYLHDAEAILLSDSPVIPVLCRGGSFQLRDGLAGLYRAADGVFFLGGVHETPDAGA